MTSYENEQNINQENNFNTKDFLIGAFIGGVVGAATALFFSPKSGKDIRQNISSQASSIIERTGQIRDVAVTKGSEIAEVAKEKTTSFGQTVSKQSNELINKVKTLKPQTIKNEELNDEVAGLEIVSDDSDIQRKLEETKRAFDETEEQLNS